MSTLSAAGYGNAALYYGGGGSTNWPANMGGPSHSIGGFMAGFTSPYLASGTLPARRTGVYYNVTGTPGGFFATRLVASMLIIPARVGPVNAIANLGGGLRPYV